ncbi:YtxH domain-containing protein [Geoanaerobacter pelophilus]|uniref:YtxH domain-containing protein n=1 Tax=Geoanaerobacter pelophilus TaxID=60036 RepID=UPI000A268687|nr:YtxH domain-containing protein [Geoanaerobacter pelophilus]
MGRKESCTGGDAVFLLVGGLIGAGLALLMAPQAGKKTRKYLCSLAEEVSGKANEAVSDFAETISDFVDTATSRATEFVEERANLSKDSKKMLLSALDKALEKLEEQRKKLEKSI